LIYALVTLIKKPAMAQKISSVHLAVPRQNVEADESPLNSPLSVWKEDFLSLSDCGFGGISATTSTTLAHPNVHDAHVKIQATKDKIIKR